MNEEMSVQLSLFGDIGRKICFESCGEKVYGEIIGFSKHFDGWYRVKDKNGDIWEISPRKVL